MGSSVPSHWGEPLVRSYDGQLKTRKDILRLLKQWSESGVWKGTMLTNK